MDRTILILGATGGIGGAVARAMLARGWTVTALVRDAARAARAWHDGPAPRWITGDAMNPGDVMAAAQGAAVIFHGVNPQGYRDWDRLVLPMLDATLRAARAQGARVVLPGTIYNYDAAATPVIDAATPQNPRGRKGAIRAEMERRLADAAPDVPSLILRAGDFFGPGAQQSWFTQALAPAPLTCIVNPGRPGVGHGWAYLPDLAETFVRLLDLPEGALARAERLQFGGFWDHDGRQMVDMIRRAAGRPGLHEYRFPWWLMRLIAPFGGFPREVVEVAPFWRHPVRLDNARLIALLGEEPATPIAEAVRHSLGADAYWPIPML
jgi:nucleoside-diphosphate-sugar epimerase